MEITGKIIQVLPEQGGVSKTSGKDWNKSKRPLSFKTAPGFTA